MTSRSATSTRRRGPQWCSQSLGPGISGGRDPLGAEASGGREQERVLEIVGGRRRPELRTLGEDHARTLLHGRTRTSDDRPHRPVTRPSMGRPIPRQDDPIEEMGRRRDVRQLAEAAAGCDFSMRVEAGGRCDEWGRALLALSALLSTQSRTRRRGERGRGNKHAAIGSDSRRDHVDGESRWLAGFWACGIVVGLPLAMRLDSA